MAFRFGDVLLVPIVFSEGSGAKKRPVLTVHDAGDLDLLVVPVPSHPSRGGEDVTLMDWRVAGLRLPSTARMSKLATVAKSTVIRTLGQLTESDARQAREALRRFFQEIF
ncbi:MAG TPA: type II toxin-antitoxin system PemK/MazF family toxin [Chthoniobacterales bacterium]|nr:type II toxin-antitoxin system PemK/MazF family toxin [Chthoniobacterales bacterium]